MLTLAFARQTLAQAPSITTPPLSKSVTVGQAVSFVVSASGGTPRAYQWRRNGQVIVGATTSTLSIAAATLADRGWYQAIASNSGGSATSVFHLDIAPSGSRAVAWGDVSAGATAVPANLGFVLAVAGGEAHSVALKADRTVAAWGDNFYGQTGIPAGLSDVVQIAAGARGVFALKGDGTIVAWGSFGNGSAITLPVFTKKFVTLAAGSSHALAVAADGTVQAWGENASGQITVPAGLSEVVAVSAGAFHSLALRADGTVVGWGWNLNGQATIPAGLSGVVSIAAGYYHSVALKSDGSVVAWGDGSAKVTTLPASLSTVTSLASSNRYAVASKSDGTVVVWDPDFGGSLVRELPWGLAGVSRVAAGYRHVLALTVPPPLGITQHPASQTVFATTGLALTVKAVGTLPLTAEWKRNGAVLTNGGRISGANTPTLLVNTVEASDAGTYAVTVTDATGSVTSTDAVITVTTPSRPANDDFANAQVLAGASGSINGTNAGATGETGEPLHGFYSPENYTASSSVWHRWTATQSGRFEIKLASGSARLVLAIYPGTALGNLGEFTVAPTGLFDQRAELVLQVRAGSTYRIAVASMTSSRSAFGLEWSFTPAPANDDFANAQILAGDTGTVGGTHATATAEPAEPVHSDVTSIGSSSVWFRWTAGQTGMATFAITESANLQTVVAIYRGTSVSGLTRIVRGLGSSTELRPVAKFSVTAGQECFVAVDVRTGVPGTFTLNYQIEPVASIVVQPTDGTAVVGGETTLSVQASGGGLKYQWYHEGDVVPGATAATITLTSLTTNQAGRYHVRVSNQSGALTSATVTLRGPNPPPTITTQPQDVARIAGQPFSLSVAANGVGPLTYRWRRNGVPLVGATAATFTVTAASQRDNDYYDVQVFDGLSASTSQTVRVIVAPTRYPAAEVVTFADTSPGEVIKAGSSLARTAAGKIVVAGSFDLVNGQVRRGLARLNPDGTIDPSFRPAVGFFIGRVIPVADDKLVLVGFFNGGSNNPYYAVVRLNSDGAVDLTFAQGEARFTYSPRIGAVVAMPDGRILIGGWDIAFQSALPRALLALRANGTVDETFTVSGINEVTALAVQNDGKILYADADWASSVSRSGKVRRLNADGTLDGTFDASAGADATSGISVLAVQADGRILAAGQFSTFSGIPRQSIVRLSATGVVDSTFVATGITNVTAVIPQADGGTLVRGSFQESFTYRKFFRLRENGSFDPSYSRELFTEPAAVLVLPDGAVIMGGANSSSSFGPPFGLARFNLDGTIDATFAPMLRNFGNVHALAHAANGATIVAGTFQTFGAHSTPRFARRTAAGLADPAFVSQSGSINSGNFDSIVVKGGGEVTFFGGFSQPGLGSGIGQLTATGSIDPAFQPGGGLNPYFSHLGVAHALLMGDRLAIAASATDWQGLPVNGLVVIRRDGSRDTTFDVGAGTRMGDGVGRIEALALQRDQKLIAGGSFSTFAGQSAGRVVRLNSNGSIDSSFAVGSGANLPIWALIVQPDGKILVGGEFSHWNGASRPWLVRLLATGAIDPDFEATKPDGRVEGIILQPDGRMIVRGQFTSVGGMPATIYLARLNADGSPDPSFKIVGLEKPLRTLLVTDDGRMLGAPMSVHGVSEPGLLEFVAGSAPTIVVQPSSQSVAAGSTAAFGVTADSPVPMTYQWFFQGEPIAGATAGTLTINNAQVANGGEYRVVVTNAFGATTSAAATLGGANPLPVIVAAPPGGSFSTGQNLTLAVNATGVGTLSYRWFKDGVLLVGQTSATLNFGAASLVHAGRYLAVVNDGLSTTVTPPVSVAVFPPSYPEVVRADPTFPAAFESAGGYPGGFLRLASGKVLTFGSFTRINSVASRNVARLTINGAGDSTFSVVPINGTVYAAVEQPDGKLVIGGVFSEVGGQPFRGVARLLADGALDASFAPTGDFYGVFTLALQSNGKVLLGGGFPSRLARVDADGRTDTTFAPAPNGVVNALAVHGDGRVFVGGSFSLIANASRNNLALLNSDGTIDTGFATGAGLNGQVYALRMVGTDRVLAGGSFTNLNGATASRIVRVQMNGTVDGTFTTGTGFNSDVYTLEVLADGRVLVGGAFGGFNGTQRLAVARLNFGGGLDLSFAPLTFTHAVIAISYLDDGTVLVGGGFSNFGAVTQYRIARLSANGSQLVAGFGPGLLSSGAVNRLVRLPDGKLLAAGAFSHVNGISRSGLARLNADGSLDSAFNPAGTGAVGAINDVVVLPDGKLFIAGSHSSYNGTSGSVRRLTANGAIDSSYAGTFVPSIPSRVVPLRTGNLLLLGSSLVSGTPPKTVASITPSGGVDPDFLQGVTGEGIPLAAVVQPDGKIVIAGSFSSYNGVARDRIVRLHPNGTIDESFAPRVDGTVNALAQRTDGKLLLAGDFFAINDTRRSRVAQLLPHGSVDDAFDANVSLDAAPSLLVPQPDGRVFVVGGFGAVPRFPAYRRLIRLGTDGAFDSSFCIPGLTSTPVDIVMQDDGSLLLAGGDLSTASSSRSGTMKTLSAPGPQLLVPPRAVTIAAGEPLSLNVWVAGGRNLSYQWTRNSASLSGATDSSYTVASAQAVDSGSYTVRLTHSDGLLPSGDAVVTVTPSAPVFAAANSAITGFGGAILTGSRWPLEAPALAAATQPISYQWHRNGAPISGATSSTFFPATWSPADAGIYSVSVANSVSSITTSTFQQLVTSSLDWDWRAPAPQGNSLSKVAFLNGRFLAGGVRGTILTSADGQAWTTSRLGVSNSVFAFAFGNGAYVALSGFSGLWTSADGVAWTPRNSGAGLDGRHLSAVIFGASRFVAVGAGGRIVYSDDGVNWFSANTSITDALSDVAFGAGKFVALGSAGRTFTSANGANWTPGPTLPRAVQHLAYGSGRFMAASTTHIYVSTNANTWTGRSLGDGTIGALQFTGSGFIALSRTTAGAYWISADGSAWTSRTVSVSGVAGLSGVAAALTWGNGVFVLVGAAPEPLVTSNDGNSWTRSGATTAWNFTAAAAGVDSIMAVGSNGWSVKVPASGAVSLSQNIAAALAGQANDVAFGAGVFVAVGTGGRIATYSTGPYWESRTSGSVQDLQGVNFLAGRFYAVGANGTMLTSTDGASWSPRVTSTAQVLRKIAHGLGTYVAVGGAGTVLTSADGAAWTTATVAGITSTISDVIFAAEKFVLVSEGGSIRTSPDGITWTARTNPLGAALKSVVYAGGRFHAFTTGGTNYLTSPDGATWTAAQHGNANASGDAVVLGDRLYLVGANTTIVSLPLNATAPTIGTAPASQVANVGSPVTFSVGATGTGPLRYQWFKDGSVLLGATGSTLSIAALSALDAGSYSVIVTNAAGSVLSSGANLTVNLIQPGFLASQARATAGATALRGAFTVEGSASKPMLIRAVGPTLANFSVTGFLADPTLTIASTATETEFATNNDWGSAANAAQVTSVAAQVGAYPLLGGSKDAAVLANFPPGTYRVIVGPVGDVGIASLEIYDASSAPRLVYVATRAQMGAAGTFAQGVALLAAPAGRTYLIRVLGPSTGLTSALADPELRVFSGETQLAANDNWGGSAALMTLADNVGAMPIPPGSKDAALSFTPAVSGAYTLQVSGVGGTAGTALLEVFESDAQRAASVTVAVVSLPNNLSGTAGQTAKFGVVAVGKPAPTFQWSRNGSPISGAVGSTLVIPSAQVGDAGTYTVRVSNGGASAYTAAATLAITAANNATHGIIGRGYVAGSIVTLTTTLHFVGAPASLNWNLPLPDGWSFASDTSTANQKPAAGATGTLAWTWTTPPASPLTFTCMLNVPTGETAARPLAATFLVGGAAAPVVPSSLTVGPKPPFHSADTDGDYALSLFELTRVIELYNTRAGTVRTGAYRVDFANLEDGFGADSTRVTAPAVALVQYHSADTRGATTGSPRDGMIDLFELTRVIELYNTRAGTVRTGRYRVQSGTEDGFSAGP